jgi:hypothetical protein
MAISDHEFATIAAWLDGCAAKEKEARRAIGRILGDEALPVASRLRLAALFDPDLRVGTCRFVFKPMPKQANKRRGRHKVTDDWKIASVVCNYLQQGDKRRLKKQAYAYAAEKFGVCSRTVEAATARCLKRVNVYAPKIQATQIEIFSAD